MEEAAARGGEEAAASVRWTTSWAARHGWRQLGCLPRGGRTAHALDCGRDGPKIGRAPAPPAKLARCHG
uniref:Uncharacterized protein n=1 Tax=Oryza rufipogon TaxID=4529 RepID=A0A0E0Q255_ORYRU